MDPSNSLVPGAVSEPEGWNYVTDELSTRIDEAYAVEASGTLQGQVVEAAEYHVAVADGTFRWFTEETDARRSTRAIDA